MTISRAEFAERLEEEGHHTAAANVRCGTDFAEATAYVRGAPCRYDDDESRWLQAYVDAGCVAPTSEQIAAVNCETEED